MEKQHCGRLAAYTGAERGLRRLLLRRGGNNQACLSNSNLRSLASALKYCASQAVSFPFTLYAALPPQCKVAEVLEIGLFAGNKTVQGFCYCDRDSMQLLRHIQHAMSLIAQLASRP